PDDFVHWLRRRGADCSGQEIVDRRSLGAWLENKLLETSLRAAQLDIPFTVRAATRMTDLMHREDACLVGLDDGDRLRCDAVVLAAGGISSGDALATRELTQRLSLRGVCMPDPLGFGWVTERNGAAIGADGRTRRLYVLGPARRQGRRGTPVPELRRQAAELAPVLVRASAVADRVRRLARARAPFAPIV
ncbi:MAG TPA: FAD/NAD(P)-binding protein, partial [Woeseiaceae bacterium]